MYSKNPVSVGFRDGRHRVALSCIRGLNPKRVLDIGCGTGEFLAALSREFPDAELAGCDRSDEAVDGARETCPKAKIMCGDFMDLELGRVDLLVALEVMEHNENFGKMLEKAMGLVEGGGHILISIPRPELLRWRVIWGLWTHTFGRWGLGEHTWLTENEIISIGSGLGLKMEKRSRFFMGCISTMLFEVPHPKRQK